RWRTRRSTATITVFCILLLTTRPVLMRDLPCSGTQTCGSVATGVRPLLPVTGVVGMAEGTATVSSTSAPPCSMFSSSIITLSLAQIGAQRLQLGDLGGV